MTGILLQPPPPASASYIGRFAPSPSGPLHFGSLVTALASYLDAKAHQGRWLVRMEDLDPPREQPGAADSILRSLDTHGLHWDGEVLYQSQRVDVYQAQLDTLIQAGLAYPCNCSRQRLQNLGGSYDGHCRLHPPASHTAIAWRLKLYDLPYGFALPETIGFTDVIQGVQAQGLRIAAGDQILKRRDGFYAYQLAVVVDDIAQGITHIIRGADLLAVTGRQIAFFLLLGQPAPTFGHLPLALQPNGQKLSKQNQAPALVDTQAAQNLWQALHFLGQNPPVDLRTSHCEELLSWAVAHWQRTAIHGLGHCHKPE
ncbi:tRNA glutamyl-Q(34) synthetase GluQRS [Cellvibrio japonicus]|uniref:Glutamyl-Q tRNA(Asp) synthetase n=1 Tax=Cellvibrio japonicus (strain Ueda107) TaxID=498211 RepID=B3PI53_CELJU|nr:tRNA glutamyl-Q(34) synthetase GluQRS [Cellvibrio japonicus]ACE86026.1 glutamyl- and glutaminyl-tRNA synthetase [Cellvibrio japonicus Ueda107]QEI11102.1 tRNA glutamyl-Q(34) synthetase GluQRS [Cellvibrio japonicus]QEI14676.1 tRNA glutamyl-Q(34) synthetase GluQRS [Cellvibrio japonicus]QEI18256.1 tRNA glutamyl-Q(34) synthetase GluQRS [Cellvibrio japonicus]